MYCYVKQSNSDYSKYFQGKKLIFLGKNGRNKILPAKVLYVDIAPDRAASARETTSSGCWSSTRK